MSEKDRDIILFIEDILSAIQKIEKYTSDKTASEFQKDDMALDAVIRNFEVIGEAARNIPAATQSRFPAVEWKEVVGFRNILIHNYFGVDVESVWDTVQKNIPLLKQHVLAMKASLM